MSISGENYASWIQPDEETLLDRFEEAWLDTPPADLDCFAAEAERCGEARPLLEELVKIDLEYRWRGPETSSPAAVRTGNSHTAPNETDSAPPRLEEYLARFSQLQPTLDLIAEEYRVRCRWGDNPSPSEYVRRFPEFNGAIPTRFQQVEKELRNESTHHKASGGTHHVGNETPHVSVLHLGHEPADPEMATLEDISVARPEASEANASSEPQFARKPNPPLPERIGRYQVAALLGEGAFGAVYLAHDPQLKRNVAIKTPHSRHLRNRRSRKQFLEEAQLAAQLQHPVLVAIYDIETGPEQCYLVMEYIEGKSLSDYLRDDWPKSREFRYAAQLMADVAEAVHEAHKRGLIHRDLKPANILLDKQGRPHVTDFGLALREEDQRRRAWEVSGTPAYMAPEQVRGESHRLDGRCDLWSLGAILYEMLTGRRTFGGRKVHDVFDEIVHREPKPPRQIDDTIPVELERICLRCLVKDVAGRYTTSLDLCEDLRRFLEADWIDAAGGDFPLLLSRSGFVRASTNVSASSHHSSLATSMGNLPQPAGAIIGRDREVAEVRRLLLEEKTPMVTLLGPGGVGKTRLAQEAAHTLAQPLPGGCWWVDLSACSTAAGVTHAVLEAFGAGSGESEPPEERVASILQYRPRLLLILDNFEQVAEFAQATVGEWRRRAPHVQFLITSREPLGLSGERHYELEPLAAPPEGPAPESPAEAAEFASVALFVRRAQEADPRFALDASNAADVARICTQLEGLPLAVELAAARVKILKPAQMLKKFDQKLQFLRSTRRDLSDRQRTLEGAIHWSYDHLEAWEQRAFLQISLFRSGFYLDAAEEVIDLSEFPDAPDVIDVVQCLREKCLLRTLDEKYELRLGMYQSIREFGEQLRRAALSAEQEAVLHVRLAEHLTNYCEYWNQLIHTSDGLEALDRVALETENLFAVQDWAESQNRPELAARAILALAETMAIRGPADQRLPRLERALKAAPAEYQGRLLAELSFACHATGDWNLALWYADQAVADLAHASAGGSDDSQQTRDIRMAAARALRQQGVMRRLRGDIESALASFRASEETARQAGDRHGMAAAIAQRGFVVWQQGGFDEALQCYLRAEALARETGDQADLATIARQRGHLLAQRGDYHEATKCFEQTEKLARELGDRRSLHQAITARGTLLSDQGKYEEALECYERAERIARQLGEKRGVAVNRGNRGLAYADRGDYEKALACYSEAAALNRELGVTAGIALNIGNRGVALAGLGRYDEALVCLEEAQRLHEHLGNRLQEAINRGEIGTVLLAQQRLDDARRCLSEALATFDELVACHTPEYFNFVTTLAVAHSQSGDDEVAARHAARAQVIADEIRLTPGHPRLRIRENLELLRGLTARPS